MKLKNNNKININLVLILILSAIIITLASLIINTIIAIKSNNPYGQAINIDDLIKNKTNNLWTPIGPWANIWTSLSTFTIQTNILVLIFFILALINYIKKEKFYWIHGYFKLALTVYISITMIIFWTSLFSSLIKLTNFNSSIGIANFINTFLLHLITPLITIIYFFFTAGSNKWLFKPTFTKGLALSNIYLFVYLGYALIKGNFVGFVKVKIIDNTVIPIIENSYPYFFLNIKNNLNIFFIYLFIILSLFLILFFTFYLLNNWKNFKYQQLLINNQYLKKRVKTKLVK